MVRVRARADSWRTWRLSGSQLTPSRILEPTEPLWEQVFFVLLRVPPPAASQSSCRDRSWLVARLPDAGREGRNSPRDAVKSMLGARKSGHLGLPRRARFVVQFWKKVLLGGTEPGSATSWWALGRWGIQLKREGKVEENQGQNPNPGHGLAQQRGTRACFSAVWRSRCGLAAMLGPIRRRKSVGTS